MGCVCSRPTEEITSFSNISNPKWTICCFRSCCFPNAKCNIPCPSAPKHEASSSVHSTSMNDDQSRYDESEANIDSNEHGSDMRAMDSDHIKDQDTEYNELDVIPFRNVKHKNGSWRVESISVVREDCPICLEGYDAENPRFDTFCEHHFHLACILEWMERSTNCPMCNNEMVFDAST